MCGIFGIITPKPRKLDRRAFCVLGVNNDSRGGDSCGVFIDKKYEYGVNEYKLFYNFFPKSKILNTVTHAQVALGHCRKASVGAINAANAQPVVIKNENGEVEFALIHNGTIINYQEMAKKYIPDVDIKDMTDSQVMARIFYHAGYDVLGEYLGAGAFVMVDYRNGNPEVFIFKGESKSAEYSTITTIERPLFCTYTTTEFIFSSIIDYLRALRPDREVMTVSSNKLLKLYDGKLSIVEEYDRKSKWQTRSYSSTTRDLYSSVSNIARKGTETGYDAYSNFGTHYHWEVVDMDEEGVYWIGNEKAHGVHWVDALGDVYKRKEPGTIQVAFWKGVLLRNVSCYTFLAKLAKEREYSVDDLLILYPDLVHYLSASPCWKTYKGSWVASDTPTSHFAYTGTAVFPFTTEECYFRAGRLDYYEGGIPYRDALLELECNVDFKVDGDLIRKQLDGR